jgi:predicted Zn-dependent protease
MRYLIAILFVLIILNSCNVRPKQQIVGQRNDTIQFTYLYSEALRNKMLGRDEMALDQFTQCLRMKPKSSASAYQLAVLSFESDEYDKAKDYADFCLALKPENEWYLLLRASIAKMLDERDIYESIYNKLVTTYPENLNYNYELAIIYFDKKKYNESLTILNELSSRIGVNENISFLKNHIYYEQKRFDAIKYELKLLSKSYPDSVKYSDMLAEFYLKFNEPSSALNMYFDILKKDSTNSNALVGVSWLYGKLNYFAKGYPYLNAVVHHNDIDFARKLKVADLYLKARTNRIGEDSINYIYSGLATDTALTSVFLTEYIAYLYSRRDYSTAERYCKVSINKFPDDYTSWDYYFNILLVLNRINALNNESLKALEYFPNQASVYFYAGYSYFLLKKYNQSVDYLEMGIDYVIENEELEKQFYLTLAECYHSLGKDKDSDKYFDNYLAIDSTNAYLMNNYAYYLAKRNNKLDKALNLSRKSIEIEPFNSSFLDTYSWILYTLAEYDKALNYIQRAYKYGGNKNPVVLEHYGDILMKIGNTVEAIDRWKDAYQLNKSDIVLKKITEAGG